jgi:PAS domain S-box-containing protein
MGSDKVRVLIVEDNSDDAELEVQALRRDDLDVTWKVVATEPDFLEALAQGADVILCDRSLPEFSAGRVLEIMRERRFSVPVLVVSGTVSDALAVDFMRQGACDYVLKDRLARLGPAVRNALDRFRLERDALAADSRLARITDQLEVAAVTADLNGHVTACNDVAWRMLGYESAEAFRAMPTTALYVDPERRAKLFELLAAQDRVRSFEVEFKRADGTTLWTTGEYRSVHDGSGRVVGVETMLINTTERKQAELEIALSRERLDSALRSAPIVVQTFDQDLRFTFAGGAALQSIGLDGVALFGTSVRDFLKDRPELVAMFERAVQGEEFVAEFELRGRYFHVRFSPIAPDRTHGAGGAAVAFDITERHEAERKADARARHRAAARDLAQEALNGVPVSQLMDRAVHLAADAVGVEMSSVHEIDLEAGYMRKLASTGYRAPDARVPVAGNALIEWLVMHADTRAVDDFMSDDMPRSQSLAAEGVRAILAAGIRDEKKTFGILSVSSRSPRHWTDDEREFVELMGKTLWVAVQSQRLEQERRRLMSRLVDAQEQERRRIASDVHDDAVQIMSAVTMRLHLLAQRLSDPEQLAVVSKLQSTVSLSIERLRHLLFELSPPALERHGLVESLETLVDGFQRDFGIVTDLRADIDAEPDPAAGLVVYRVVQEALINVHKHAHAKHVTLAIRGGDDGIQGRVEDDGVGFDPDAADKSINFGHMGLTSMRERAELAGGWWKVVSAPNKGSRVEFSIPSRARKPEVA